MLVCPVSRDGRAALLAAAGAEVRLSDLRDLRGAGVFGALSPHGVPARHRAAAEGMDAAGADGGGAAEADRWQAAG